MTTFHHLMLPDDTLDTPRRYGVTGNGVTDDTAALARLFTAGGDIYIPDGDYLIAGAGADTGGVSVSITKSTCVRCHPNARFFTDSLDNDLIRFTVPSTGSGFPTDGITFEWYGGVFDQRNQKNSTVVPNIAEYPPANPGASATCDALSVRGDYSVASVFYSGIKRAHIEGVTCNAGDHWESAGGDSGIFVGGCAHQTVTGCRMIGNRDLGIYASGSTDGVLQCKTSITNNQFINCFFGASIKRSSGDCVIEANDAQNCVSGYVVSLGVGSGFNRLRISGNTGRNLGIPIRLDLTLGFDVSDNHFTTLGALLEDGTTIESVQGCNGIELRGCKYGIVRNNTVRGIETGVAAAYPAGYMLFAIKQESTTVTDSEHCMLVQNIGDALRTAGTDSGTRNSYIENYVVNAVTSANVSSPGTNYFEVRVDTSTMMRGFSNPVGFSDGSASAPSIVRRAQVTTGLFFAASRLSAAIAGVETMRVDNDATAGNTRLMLWDVDANAMVRVSTGADDSGDLGHKVLQVPN
jgi:parallel beta-helix repeat protein